ncbi:MAG TPA: hypothetical protein VFX58_05995 [Chitinophagaceae bacterium]|nr:hypothetical protein [Chitinophagaceae bacterium]
MTNITLADYMGFIFSEITRARDHADRVAKEIAEIYSKDEILQSFSVPRFKIPEMEIRVPVIIAGAKFTNALSFVMPVESFKTFILAKVNNAINAIKIKKSGVNNDFTIVRNINMIKNIRLNNRIGIGRGPQRLEADSAEGLILEFYNLLIDNDDPSTPENIVDVKWAEIFNKKIEEQQLLQDYKQQNPNNELYNQVREEVIAEIRRNTVITKSKIENLLVNPETQAVKNDSSEISVFSICAKITEEGLYIKSMKDDEGNLTRVAEFE